MSASPASWTVRVPASTSNLGPGFDLLGLALGLWLEARAEPLTGLENRLVRRSARGPDSELPADPHQDLLWVAFEALRARVPFPGAFRLEVASEIPVGRGLGSSGAAVLAGLLLARAASGQDLPLDEILELGIALEGHPDNLAAALAGGLTLCQRRPQGSWRSLRCELSPRVAFAVAWPAQPLPTPRARAVLPASVSFADAVENPRRLAFLIEGLRRGDPELITMGGQDRLHVAYRLPLLPGAERALAAALRAGAWMATLSGAGSGLVALGEAGRMEPVAAAMAEVLERETGLGVGRVLEPAEGACWGAAGGPGGD